MTAEEIKAMLGLKPHPREGGCFVRTWESREVVPQAALPPCYTGARASGTAIYYLLEPDTFSEMHRLKSDEVFHFYLGAPVEMLQLWPDGTSRVVVLGHDLAAGMRPQLVVPQGVWQGSRMPAGAGEERFALLGCTVSPGFDFDDYEAGDRAALVRDYPVHRAMIEALTRS
ncbi:MAG TPA: cupin domain-containing protein [Acidisarcina sp.]